MAEYPYPPLSGTWCGAVPRRGSKYVTLILLYSKGLFTWSDCVYVIAMKWVPLMSIVLFTLSDAKHQRENR